MTEVVQPVDGVPQRHEVVDVVHVPPAVFPQPVDDEQDGLHIPVGEPGLVIDVGVPHAFEIAFDMLHKLSPFRIMWK